MIQIKWFFVVIASTPLLGEIDDDTRFRRMDECSAYAESQRGVAEKMIRDAPGLHTQTIDINFKCFPLESNV
jgi:hypothetical protein